MKKEKTMHELAKNFQIKLIGNWKDIEMQIVSKKLVQIPMTESQNHRKN